MIGPAEIGRRFSHHRADGETAERHRLCRAEFEALAGRLDGVLPDGREKSLVMTSLEEAMFWANAAIARWWSGPPPVVSGASMLSVSQSHVPSEVAARTQVMPPGPRVGGGA